jgi:hypothetical protein
MEKKWLLRLPKDLDNWLTIKAAEETVTRGKRVSKNTLVIEFATEAREGKIADRTDEKAEVTVWHNVKSALEFIQGVIEGKADSPVADRMQQRVAVNLKILESYLDELGE